MSVGETIKTLRVWAEHIIAKDGDRDEDAASNLRVEQSITVAKVMLAAAEKLGG